MERLLKLLDDCDDLSVLLRTQGRALLATLLLVAFVAGVLVLGPPDLFAAPWAGRAFSALPD